jgi:hypothetical protein
MPSELERYVSDNALQVGAHVVFLRIKSELTKF